MASLEELDKTLPAYFTLSNKHIIFIAHVRDETVYFYDQLGSTTTVVLLAEPKCYALKKIFLEFMNDLGTTVIDLREPETFDPNYVMSDDSVKIIQKLLTQYKFDKIITHPKYTAKNDPQNRALFDIVSNITNVMKTNNHYTYNQKGLYGIPELPCGTKKGILELYCRAVSKDNVLDKKMYDNYASITSNINGVRKVVKLIDG
jgi:hypothetical protein